MIFHNLINKWVTRKFPKSPVVDPGTHALYFYYDRITAAPVPDSLFWHENNWFKQSHMGYYAGTSIENVRFIKV